MTPDDDGGQIVDDAETTTPAIMTTSVVRSGRIRNVDCLVGMRDMDVGSVDLVFADLPYGRTQNDWDTLVPMVDLWSALRRVCKPSAALVFTAMQPFASLLVCSNLAQFRYEVIWQKNKPRGFLNAKRQPLRTHENVLVFYDRQPRYAPQMTSGHPPAHSYTKRRGDGSNYGETRRGMHGAGGGTDRYPTSVLPIPVVNESDPNRIHPTQKPEALAAWFIATYSRAGDLVLDPTAGSGSTGVAALRMGRRFVGFETDPAMTELANAALDEVLVP